MDSIFVNQVNRLSSQSSLYGLAAKFGCEAFGIAGDSKNLNIAGIPFTDGDVAEVPPMPIEGCPQESDKQWISKPLVRGGDPVVSALCRVTGVNGVVSCKELFAGTLKKSAVNYDTDEVITNGHGSTSSCSV